MKSDYNTTNGELKSDQRELCIFYFRIMLGPNVITNQLNEYI